MAGHSKWANIKRHKAKQDAKRGKLYTKLIREITVSANISADPNSNPRLRAAIDKAQEANMTKDVIDRAIKRGDGGSEGNDLEEIRYEGYGPHGVAVIVDCMTNNRNRTVSEVRFLFNKYHGNLGTDGSVAYLFKKQGQLTFSPPINEDQLMELALELGALDIQTNSDKSVDVFTAPENFIFIKQELAKSKFQPEHSDVTLIPSTFVSINEKEAAELLVELLEALEDLDDVQTVYSNVDIAENVLA